MHSQLDNGAYRAGDTCPVNRFIVVVVWELSTVAVKTVWSSGTARSQDWTAIDVEGTDNYEFATTSFLHVS